MQNWLDPAAAELPDEPIPRKWLIFLLLAFGLLATGVLFRELLTACIGLALFLVSAVQASVAVGRPPRSRSRNPERRARPEGSRSPERGPQPGPLLRGAARTVAQPSDLLVELPSEPPTPGEMESLVAFLRRDSDGRPAGSTRAISARVFLENARRDPDGWRHWRTHLLSVADAMVLTLRHATSRPDAPSDDVFALRLSLDRLYRHSPLYATFIALRTLCGCPVELAQAALCCDAVSAERMWRLARDGRIE